MEDIAEASDPDGAVAEGREFICGRK